MAGLLLILFISVHLVVEGQVYFAPTLTVDPKVVTHSDQVRLNCETVFPDSQCYFFFDDSKHQAHPCQHTLSGQKLLSLVNKRSPADVTVTCFYYIRMTSSQYSNKVIVYIRDLTPPSLAVEPSVITETDSVTLSCQTPSFASGPLCTFILNGLIQSSSTCVQTVRGSDLLKDQSPPAQVQGQCYYRVYGRNSPYSNTQTVTVQNMTPPSLAVEPSVITETDSVTLSCQTPVFASGPLCYFILNRLVQSSSTCVQTVRGSDLLKDQSPAQVQVQCYYRVYGRNSPYSNRQTVPVQNLTTPSLAVEPSVITETDSVTLSCQTPVFASGPLCYFILNRLVQSSSTCVQTVRGSDLLKDQSPAQVQVQCYYRVYRRYSPYSNRQTVTVQSSKPEVSVEVHSDIVGIVCSLFGSAKSSTVCHLYYGESLRPFLSKYVEANMKDSRQFCHFFISLDDLQRNVDILKTKEISCDYSLENGDKSPRSDGYNMSRFKKDAPGPKPHVTTAALEPVKITHPGHVTGSETKAPSPESTTTILTSGPQDVGISAEPVPSSTLKDGDLVTSQQPISARWIWGLVVLLTVCGVIVASVLLVLSLLCTKQAPANSHLTKDVGLVTTPFVASGAQLNISQDSNFDAGNPQNPSISSVPVDPSPFYSLITSAPATEGTSTVDRKKPKREVQYESCTYHLYATIEDDPAPAAEAYSCL